MRSRNPRTPATGKTSVENTPALCARIQTGGPRAGIGFFRNIFPIHEREIRGIATGKHRARNPSLSYATALTPSDRMLASEANRVE
uniref:Uncharacterized protein n=1 Tax=Candidatus Kentrum sp. TC TaxID=2126339 RepID=A0A450Z140_9GAMM|nr:MAG: hypothetical protein BECKTC1821D_GA0114238_104812 [Candidatus Kentron sp. TC]